MTTDNKPTLAPEMENSFRLAGKYIDEEVARGRSLDEVLNEHGSKTGQAIWFDPNNLRHYSEAVADSFDPSPIPLRVPHALRHAVEQEASYSNLPRSEVMRQLLQEALTERELKTRDTREARDALEDARQIILDWFKVDHENRKARAVKALLAIGDAQNRIIFNR